MYELYGFIILEFSVMILIKLSKEMLFDYVFDKKLTTNVFSKPL